MWARADTVVWLDLPRRTVMRRIIQRSVGRVASRVELWNGNRERWRNLFTLDKEESVISWAWQTHTANRVKFEAAMADPENDHLRFVWLTSPAAVRRFLRAAAQPDTSQPDTSQPDTSQPGASRPDASQPGASRQDASQPALSAWPGAWPGSGGDEL